MRPYGSLIRFGLVVPPANATVEPEIAALMPSGAALHVARLPGAVERDTSRGLDSRIKGYVAALPDVVRSFGGMELDALCLMHTGCSYVVGIEGEARLREALALSGADRTYTVAETIAETLAALGAERIALVVPYPDWLAEASVAYWTARGFSVLDVAKPRDIVSIYEIPPDAVLEAMSRLDRGNVDAILLTGTGMATLGALESCSPRSEIPVISANQCAAWEALRPRIASGMALHPVLHDLRARLGDHSRAMRTTGRAKTFP